MKFFIPIKRQSRRLPNKSFLALAGVELYRYVLYKLTDWPVFVDTDSKEILHACRRDANLRHVTCYRRSPHLTEYEESQMERIYEGFFTNHVQDNEEPIVQTFVTAPFVKVSTMLDACKKIAEGYDSVLATTLARTYAIRFGKGKPEPMNFDPGGFEKTQDLAAIRLLNNAFFVMTKKSFLKTRSTGVRCAGESTH